LSSSTSDKTAGQLPGFNDQPTAVTNNLGETIILNQPSCPSGTYESFGICIGCKNNFSKSSNGSGSRKIKTKTKTKPNATSSSSSSPISSIHDVRTNTAIALVSMLFVVFLSVVLAVWCATKKHSELHTISHGCYRAKEFMVFFILSLQTAAYVGPVARVAGGDAITDPHRIMFGVYSSFTLDLRSIAPPACGKLLRSANFHWLVLSTTLVLWLPTMICLFYFFKYPAHTTEQQNTTPGQTKTCRNYSEALVGKICTLLSIVYGFTALLVFEVFVHAVEYSISVVLFCYMFVVAFILGYPLITGFIVHRMTPEHRLTTVYTRSFVNYCKPSYWYVRHLHFLFILILAIDKAAVSYRTDSKHQISSTFLGILPGILYICFLLYAKPYLHRRRWMMWTRVCILVQVSFGYVVKIAGCLCHWPRYTTISVLLKPRKIIVVLSYIWLMNYFMSFVVLMVGFFVCILSPHENEVKELVGGQDGIELIQFQYEKPEGFKSIKPHHFEDPVTEEAGEAGEAGWLAMNEVELSPKISEPAEALNPGLPSPTMNSKRETLQMDGDSAGWVQTHDDAGNEFYYNTCTSESRWDLPNYARKDSPQSSTPSWVEMVRSDSDGTRVVYVHTGTHEESHYLPENWVQNVRDSVFNHK
jgi:hypothetical protein